MISNDDSRKGLYREKLDTIKKLKHEFKLDDSLVEQLQAFIIFHTIKRDNSRDMFIKALPERLRLDLCYRLFQDYKKKIVFFQEIQKADAYFISWLCPQLQPLQVIEDAYIQMEMDKLTHISFI